MFGWREPRYAISAEADTRKASDLTLVEVLMNQGDRRRAFSDSGGNPFDGTAPNVPRGEQAGGAGLEPEGVAVEGPCPGPDAVAAGGRGPAR
jgi:hypothetical protein